MGSLYKVEIKIIVSKHRTAHRSDTDSLILHVHFFENFSDESMGDSMGASGAVMGSRICESSWALVNNFNRWV
jgi:hypothetical protein